MAPYACPLRPLSLPVVDLSPAALGGDANRAAQIANLVDSFTDYGFCFVTGLEGYDGQALFEAMRWFFYDVSEEDRYVGTVIG